MTAQSMTVRGALPPATNSFRLDGPSIALDPRIHAFRPDIADLALAGQVFATHYARPKPARCAQPSVMVRSSPSEDEPAISQLLLGDEFAVIDISGGWAWGYCRHDHYVGYVRADALGAANAPISHVVTAPSALVFAEADIKSAIAQRLPMGAHFTALETGAAGFIRSAAGWLHPRHVAPVGSFAADPVAIAEQLQGVPYVWGGRGGDGLDCSGLVQLTLGLCGIYAPRDSDQQRDTLGSDVPPDSLQRGDLVFFPGHVGMMVDAERMIHASAWWMRVVVEPLADVIALLKAEHAEPVVAVRRL